MFFLSFQSTHSRGVRPRRRRHFAGYLTVSIHALTRSATIGTESGVAFASVSIHALTRSATLSIMKDLYYFILFQSTHSRGVRLSVKAARDKPKCFNPRTHEECDNRRKHTRSITAIVSIHALTRSATYNIINIQ